MNAFLGVLFSQYQDYPIYLVAIELFAVFLGILSVFFAKKQNILVFPTGIISTSIFVYLLAIHQLWGNMLINAYFTLVSLYGWYLWSIKDKNNQPILKVHRANKKNWFIAASTFTFATLLVYSIYKFNGDVINFSTYLDIITTAISFAAMILMAQKVLQNWTLWIISNVLALPMYFNNHLYFTAFEYFILTLIAITAYFEWKQYLPKLQNSSL